MKTVWETLTKAAAHWRQILIAFLALAGDLGGTAGPMAVGFVSGLANNDLKKGFLVATIFPVVLVLGLMILKGRGRRRVLQG